MRHTTKTGWNYEISFGTPCYSMEGKEFVFGIWKYGQEKDPGEMLHIVKGFVVEMYFCLPKIYIAKPVRMFGVRITTPRN